MGCSATCQWLVDRLPMLVARRPADCSLLNSPFFWFSCFLWENSPPKRGVTCLKLVGQLIYWFFPVMEFHLIDQIWLMNFGQLKAFNAHLCAACYLRLEGIHGDCFGWGGAHFNAQYPSNSVESILYLSILKVYSFLPVTPQISWPLGLKNVM